MRVNTFRRLTAIRFVSFVKPGWNVSGWDRPFRQVRNDRSGGHDQSLVELGTRKALGFDFRFKRLGRPRAPASGSGASPWKFEGHIPRMILHPMIPSDPITPVF